MPEQSEQLEIANRALELMFPGIHLTAISDQQFRTEVAGTEVAGAINLRGIASAREYLREKTGRNREIDPFVRTDGTAWVIVSTVLSQLRLYELALGFALEYLDLCYDLQLQHGERIKKGPPHYWASLRHEEVGNIDIAKAHMVLAFVEDIKDHHPSASLAPAFVHLTSRWGMSPVQLSRLEDFARTLLVNFPRFPEAILTGYQLGLEPEVMQRSTESAFRLTRRS